MQRVAESRTAPNTGGAASVFADATPVSGGGTALALLAGLALG
ncbi:hypothetical protein [Cryobacterium sp. Hh11]|nr:hypothetical protein [Cryobacterium sp. Hh11]